MSQDEYTLDVLAEVSLALRNMLAQREAVESATPPDQVALDLLTGDDSGPAVYDLKAIWRAAQADEGSEDSPGRRRYMSPRRFLKRWSHRISAMDEAEDGRIFVDHDAAFEYCQQVDSRVMFAAIENLAARMKAANRADPIGAAVRSARGGPFAMMFCLADAVMTGWTPEEFATAVMARAKEEAAGLDEYAAEHLLSDVRRAIEGSPRVEVIVAEGD